MTDEDKLKQAVEIAQSYIKLLISEYLPIEQRKEIEDVMLNCPIVVEQYEQESNDFGKKTNIGGIATGDGITISKSLISLNSLDVEEELNNLVGTIIHEYAHRFRAKHNDYGSMLEESFATIFSELCVNNARLKSSQSQITDEREIYQNLTSVNYRQYESQARALLYALKQKQLDKKMIIQYITGDENLFKQICINEFGVGFNDYFNSISSKNNNDSEILLIELLSRKIENGELGLNNYWEKTSNKLSENNLYFKGSPTLALAVSKVNPQSIKPEDIESYKYFIYSSQVANQERDFLVQEKIDRINSYISKFDLKGKTFEEAYDTIVDLFSTYIQHKNMDDEESKMFIQEITNYIPYIDDFKSKFVGLRVAGKDQDIFNGLDTSNLDYGTLYANMNFLLQGENKETGFIR